MRNDSLCYIFGLTTNPFLLHFSFYSSGIPVKRCYRYVPVWKKIQDQM